MITIDLHDPFLWLALGLYLFSAVSSSLPEPGADASGLYLFFYRLVNKLVANRSNLTQIFRAPQAAIANELQGPVTRTTAPVDNVIIAAPLPPSSSIVVQGK